MVRVTTTTARVDLVVNGAARRLDVPSRWRLLDLLRDGLGLTGTKEGCDDGTCGTCVVLVDGRMARTCRIAASEAAGRDVVTIEGLGSAERPHPLQEALVAADAVQCGFCTPGMIMAAASLLERQPHPRRDEIERWLGSNLCRCTGYRGIVDAIEGVANGLPASPRPRPLAAETEHAASPNDLPAIREAADRSRVEAPASVARPSVARPSVAQASVARPAAVAARSARADAMDKATGRARYAADLRADGMLHAAVLRSPHAHADILRVQTDRALAMPGVQAILTAGDVPGPNSYGRRVKDEPVLAETRVRKVGDPVALVLADSREQAAAALPLIAVEYRELPAAFTPDEALADGAPPIHPGGNLVAEHWLRSGDIAEGFERADIVLESTYTTPWNEHAYLEPEAALASWEGTTLVVRTATQYPHYQRAEIARILGLPSERIRVVSAAVGGAFGGKTEISCQCLAALGAWKTGRPVRIVYSREESFLTTTKRHPYRIRCRAGATRDGDLAALQIDMLADTGAYSSFGPGLMVKTFGSAAGPYRWPAVELHGRVAFTNNPNAGCMRGPGTTQVAFALESQIDQLAEQVGMDPLDFRQRNRLRKGDTLLSGQVLERDPAYEATIAAIRPYWRDAQERCARPAEERSAIRRGVGVASIWYGIGGGGGGPVPGMDPAATVGRGPGRAAVDLLDDGSIRVRTGAVDLGQGVATAMGRIAAEELGLPPDRLTVLTGDSAHPDAGPTVGSRVTFFVGNAVRRAAADLGEAILGTAGGLLARPIRELEIRDGSVRAVGDPAAGVSLSEIARTRRRAGHPTTFDGSFDPDLPVFDPGTGLGEPYAMYVTATQMAEVEVDTRSGSVRVLRVIAAHDVGRPVFPEGVVGQIEGGIAMGVGFALTEEFVPGETRGFKQYRIPRTRDVPEMTAILVDDPGAPDDLRAKGVAECSNMVVAPAIANAIARATGRRLVRLPLRLPGTD
jgi:CO/xanthine dehydrogenase Mo-binding subunit/aerobic-type carbon monoxide dehydrogenase small subunit (CoxS/CutS family)